MPVIRYPTGYRGEWVDRGAGRSRLLGCSDEGARVSPITLYLEDLRALVQHVAQGRFLTSMQAVQRRKDARDELVLLIAGDPGDGDTAGKAIAARLDEIRPMFAEHIEAGLTELTVEWIQLSGFTSNSRTAKLIWPIDKRQALKHQAPPDGRQQHVDTTGPHTAESLAARFHDVDSSGIPEDFIAYLRKMEESESGRTVREITYRALEAAEGKGADIGCGAGRAVADLVRLGKDAVGVDSSQAMVDAALARFPHCRVVRGSAFELPFEDGELSWYRSERTFLHFGDPAEALSEARRVLRPGGTIVLADPDLGSMVVSSRIPETTDAVKDAFCSAVPNPHAGTRSAHHLADAGFTGIEVVPVMAALNDHAAAFDVVLEPALTAALTQGTVSEEAAARWKDDLSDLSRQNAFTATATFFVTTARLAS